MLRSKDYGRKLVKMLRELQILSCYWWKNQRILRKMQNQSFNYGLDRQKLKIWPLSSWENE
jgi:hypothetical protein